jgi:predicted transcriptional regulator
VGRPSVSERVFDLAELPKASVSIGATAEEAAQLLYRSGLGAIAVLDGDAVRGMFTEDDLLRAMFPRYLEELEHTAFLDDDEAFLLGGDPARSTPVTTLMRDAEPVELPASALDIAQRFLHDDAAALIAVRSCAFAGVIDQTTFCKAILRRYRWQL